MNNINKNELFKTLLEKSKLLTAYKEQTKKPATLTEKLLVTQNTEQIIANKEFKAGVLYLRNVDTASKKYSDYDVILIEDDLSKLDDIKKPNQIIEFLDRPDDFKSTLTELFENPSVEGFCINMTKFADDKIKGLEGDDQVYATFYDLFSADPDCTKNKADFYK